ncbi:MAG TPA: type III secretion system export apparatus subunit SctR [Myxococcota bacterium]|nr:type III secretion system export apparatus subunit SctR [Myxococcota bacterium]
MLRPILIASFLIAPELSAKSDIISSLDFLEGSTFKDPFYLLFFLIGVSLLPFLAVMVTSFTKIVVVLSIARQAIGTAQTPPNIVIMSLSLVLTCFSMYPVGLEIFDNIEGRQNPAQKSGADALLHFTDSAKEPLRNFLSRRAQKEDQELFFRLSQQDKSHLSQDIKPTDFIVLAPAFLISELSLAFQVGFLIYLPFLVIDMTVANVLMALGMQMLSPTTISLPFKILLFVLVDGWRMLSQGLVKG